MTWSIGEIRALAIKATRGCGFSWGLAEEAGFAIERLHLFGLNGITALSHYLQQYDELKPPITTPLDEPNILISNHLYHPLHLGSYLSDINQLPIEQSLQIYQPILLIPFISLINHSTTYSIQWLGNKISISAQNICIVNDSAEIITDQATCRISECSQSLNDEQQTLHTRAPNSSAKDILILEDFAMRTYAPASEQSRLSGAGSGINDND